MPAWIIPPSTHTYDFCSLLYATVPLKVLMLGLRLQMLDPRLHAFLEERKCLHYPPPPTRRPDHSTIRTVMVISTVCKRSQILLPVLFMQVLDPQLHAFLEERECLHYFFAFRWLLIHWKREFSFDQVSVWGGGGGGGRG
jgi:hypothetical protein